MEKFLIQKISLERIFNALVEHGKTMIAPRMVNGKAVYGKVAGYAEVNQDIIQTTQSAKEVMFPRTEKLFDYTKDKKEVVLHDFNPDAIPEVVLWGVHPCDARGFVPLKSIFNWDSRDKLFNTRWEKTTVITFSCHQADEFCFCTSVGGGPDHTEGSDILLTRVGGDQYLAEILTPRGEEVRKLHPESFASAAGEIEKQKEVAEVPVKFNPADIGKKLQAFFESDLWIEQSMRCLGCGACAFVCPACACFDIQDEDHGKNGSRIRCWDSCGFSIFTQHTSGHNPREVQSHRWRQRLLHKFSYMPERLSLYGCTGCGRCSRACPADMNILEHLTSIQEVSQ